MTTYGYDADDRLAGEELYGPTGAKTTTYLHGISVDEPLAFKTTAWQAYHRDALGSVTRLTDGAGSTASTYRYDAFGAIRSQTGADNMYAFTSRESETALLGPILSCRIHARSRRRCTTTHRSPCTSGPASTTPPEIGWFVTANPVLGGLGDPQT